MSIRVDKKGRDSVRELLAHLAGNTTIQFQAKSLDTSFEKKYYAAVRYFFPVPLSRIVEITVNKKKKNFIKPNKLEGFKNN